MPENYLTVKNYIVLNKMGEKLYFTITFYNKFVSTFDRLGIIC